MFGFFLNTKSNREPGDWNCSNCSEVNFKRRNSCRKCGKVKNGSGLIPNWEDGDWTCTKCQEVNFKRRTQCRKCNASKKGTDTPKLPPTMKLGDWFCEYDGCDEMNFGSRTACFKCGNPRPSESEKGDQECDDILENICKICMDAENNTVILTCRHMHMCEPCAKSMNKCPFCQKGYDPKKDLMTVYK